MKELSVMQMEEIEGGMTRQEYICFLAGMSLTFGFLTLALPPVAGTALSVGIHLAAACAAG